MAGGGAQAPATVLPLVPWVAEAQSDLCAVIVNGAGVVLNWTAPTEDAEKVGDGLACQAAARWLTGRRSCIRSIERMRW